MELTQAYYVIPFWVVTVLVLRLSFNNYAAVLLASMLFGAVEVLKGRKTDESVWRKFSEEAKIVGHRACALNAPENTLAGVREAHRLGVQYLEFDIMLSADNEPIVIHDSTWERTTNGEGEVSGYSWTEVQQLDASCKYSGPGSYSGEGVPHLKEMLRECQKYGIKVFLDMKGSRPITMANVMVEMSKEFPDLHEWAAVCSFYPQLLYAVKWKLPQFMTILTHRPWVLTYADVDGLALRNKELWKKVVAPVADVVLQATIYHFWWYFCGVNAMFIQEEVVSVGEIKYWKARGLDIFVWTVNNPNMKSFLLTLNVPYITDQCASSGSQKQ